MRKVVAYPVMLASAAGMLLCVFSYLGWLTGSYRLTSREPPLLFIGIFVVWLPTVLLLNTLTRDFKQKDLWKAALRGCPPWMRTTLWIVVGGVMAITFIPLIAGRNPGEGPEGFGLFPIAFYAVSFCVMYSLIHVAEQDASRRCLNGHAISPLANSVRSAELPLPRKACKATIACSRQSPSSPYPIIFKNLLG